MVDYYPWSNGEILDATALNLLGSSPLYNFKFGDGSDGAQTISGATTWTRPYFCTNLTIDAAQTLTGTTRQPMLIFVSGTLTVNGTIEMDTNGGQGGRGGGSGYYTDTYQSYTTSPTTGKTGCIGFGGNGGAGGRGKIGTDACEAGGGGAEGVAGGAGNLYSPGLTAPAVLPLLYHKLALGGSGGGGGGGTFDYNGRDSHGSDGGDGGGCIIIFCDSIVWGANGEINSSGEDGDSNADGHGPGGGGGGQGGVVLIFYNTTSGTPDITVDGGAGGVSTNGPNGGAGAAGFTAQIDLGD